MFQFKFILFPILISIFTSGTAFKISHTKSIDPVDIYEYPEYSKLFVNNRPIVGILTQPSAWPHLYNPEEYSYLATSYVRFLEESGVRVMPIKYNENEDYLETIMSEINGLLIPGGGTDLFESDYSNQEMMNELTEFTKTGKYLIKLAMEMNQKGIYFPIWGTCLGFELMLISVSNDTSVLEPFNATNSAKELKFLKSSLFSRMYSRMTEHMKVFLSKNNAMYFNHRYSVDLNVFQENEKLRNFFDVLTVNSDVSGKMYVSSLEAKDYPFYGVLFHPEKNAFEWKDHINVNHTQKAIESQHYFSDFFGAETRRNNNSFENSKDEKRELIFNYYPVQVSDSFMSVYIFSKPTSKEPHKSFFRSKRGNLILFTRERNRTKSNSSLICNNNTVTVTSFATNNSNIDPSLVNSESKKLDDLEETLKSLETENDELQNVEKLYYENAKKFTEKKFVLQKNEKKKNFEFLPRDVNSIEQEMETEVQR